MTSTVLKYMVQTTPNPQALKFIFNQKINNSSAVTFTREDDFSHINLLVKLFALEFIVQIYLFDNCITISKNDKQSWQEYEKMILEIIKQNIASHNIEIIKKEQQQTLRSDLSEEEKIIDSILDEHIRQSLKNDGGNVVIVSYVQNFLLLRYEGACTTCPSASLGTLYAIKNLLKKEFNSQIDVKIINEV